MRTKEQAIAIAAANAEPSRVQLARVVATIDDTVRHRRKSTVPKKVVMSDNFSPSVATEETMKMMMMKNKTRKGAAPLPLSTTTTNLGKKRPLRPGMRALRDIRKYQRSVEKLVPKAAFQRLIKEIAQDLYGSNGIQLRFQVHAVEAIQEACESYMTNLFVDANLCALHGKRQTLMARDLILARRIRGDADKKQ